ncbi:MAG: putative metal-binding motif-containing protein [Myxococcales bacterium]|nr:putative metal-binding motif-containing protein [Myxococcales bacterium]MCB9583277.1 putative metal-binding motif-containing protein [Polyangiaceae bacterium]
MSSYRTSLALLSLVALVPTLSVACGSSEDRKFVETDASAGGSGGGNTGGAAGSTGGAAGSTGGSAGSGGAIPDGGTPCTSPTECDDGEECNGTETCASGFCQPGTAKKDGDACTSEDGGAKVCFGGQCVQKCTEDKECDDNDVCTGTEVCLKGQGICATGTPLACDDNDACTNNECDPLTGCYYPVIDNDGDGQASTSLGSCGKDCDDSDKTVYDGAAELCDGKDNNCNGQKDEFAPTWYVDCDGDGFAPNTSGAVQNCDKPTQPSASCNGLAGATWTAKVPGAGTSDCWDKDADAHPYTAADNNNAFQDHAIAGAPVGVDFDYNCDGTEEPRYTTAGVSSTGGCAYINNICGVFSPAGWTSTKPPACGQTGTYSSCSYNKTTKVCGRLNLPRKQECR